jgi:hypothetical protein
MTQRLCNHQQTKDTSPPTEQYDNEASEMMARILSMSKPSRSEQPTKEDEDEEDVCYWSEDEYTVLKAFYENENPDEQEEQDEKRLEKYLLDICQKQQQQQQQQQQRKQQ